LFIDWEVCGSENSNQFEVILQGLPGGFWVSGPIIEPGTS
jgi:hypothetical protein